MAPLGRGVGQQFLDDAHPDVPLDALLHLLLPVLGESVGMVWHVGMTPGLMASLSSGPVIPGSIWWGHV